MLALVQAQQQEKKCHFRNLILVLHRKRCRQEYLEGVRKDDAVQLPTVLKILQLMQPNLEALACRFVNV